jgi:hypothetical protein
MNHRLLRAIVSIGAPALALAHATSADAQTCGTGGVAVPCTVQPYRRLLVQQFANGVADVMATSKIQHLPDGGVQPTFTAPNGYSVAVVGNDSNTPILLMNYGNAHKAPVAPLVPYSQYVASPLASVSKLLAESAIRHLIEINGAGGGFSSCRVSLSTPFLDVLPAAFKRHATANGRTYYNGITVEQILRHRGGVPSQYPLPWTTIMNPQDAYRSCGQSTIQPSDDPDVVGCYANNNYLIAAMLLPLMRDCALKSQIETAVLSHCYSLSGDARDACDMNFEFSWLSALSNSIVKDMIFDPKGSRGACNPEPLRLEGINVARGGGQANAGGYFKSVLGWCNTWGWQATALDVARAMDHVWNGAFFHAAANQTRNKTWHTGAVNDFYSVAIQLGQSPYLTATAVVVANSPFDHLRVRNSIRDSFAFAQDEIAGPALPDPPPILVDAAFAWDCTGGARPFRLKIASRYDIVASDPTDRGGLGTEEIWTATSANAPETATGTYQTFQAGRSPIGSSQGSWTLSRTATTNRITVTKTPPGGTQSTYTCAVSNTL